MLGNNSHVSSRGGLGRGVSLGRLSALRLIGVRLLGVALRLSLRGVALRGVALGLSLRGITLRLSLRGVALGLSLRRIPLRVLSLRRVTLGWALRGIALRRVRILLCGRIGHLGWKIGSLWGVAGLLLRIRTLLRVGGGWRRGLCGFRGVSWVGSVDIGRG